MCLSLVKMKSINYGSIPDLKKRVNEHKSKKVDATKHRLPVKLVYYDAYLTLNVARLCEKQVKNNGNARRTLLKRINVLP